MRAG
jgi:hypothetical protein